MLIKTGYITSCSAGQFVLPAKLADELGLKTGQQFIAKFIQDENCEYPFIVKYEKLQEGSVTDDVSNLQKCTLCGLATTTVAKYLQGKPICPDCVKKLGGMFDARSKNRIEQI